MAKMSFDYSKWDRLELSDDEDTFHPNLDKNLNIRVNRITRDRKEEEIDTEKQKLEASGQHDKAAKVEHKRPLHVGNLCKVAEERTIINSSEGVKDRLVKDGDEFHVDEYFDFKVEHKKLLDAFTEATWEQSRQMLLVEGGILLDDCSNNYFLLTALEEEMKGNKERVQKLGRQGQIISQIHQLAKPMRRPPRDLVPRFFERFDSGEAQAAFHSISRFPISTKFQPRTMARMLILTLLAASSAQAVLITKANTTANASSAQAILITKANTTANATVPYTQKVLVEGVEVYGQATQTDGIIGVCNSFPRSLVTDETKPSVTVCGSSTKVTVYLRNRCQGYHSYQQDIGVCNSKAASETCVTKSPATDSWMMTAQSYKITLC